MLRSAEIVIPSGAVTLTQISEKKAEEATDDFAASLSAISAVVMGTMV